MSKEQLIQQGRDKMADQNGSSTSISPSTTARTIAHGGVMCGATTKAGNPCRNYAVHGTQPPRCAPHGGVIGSYVAMVELETGKELKLDE
jgi:hypothetical protein